MKLKDYRFHYDIQEYIHNENTKVTLNECKVEDALFPCPHCHAPAIMTSFDAYGEYHKCTNCDNSFTVK